MTVAADLQPYLTPTDIVDSNHAAVGAFAKTSAEGATSDVDRAVKLYYAIRDDIRYDPYHIDLRPEAMRASAVLNRQFGFCIPKAILLAAAARRLGIPSRLGFADVKNHLTTERLRRLMKTDVFAFHGYTELWLEGKWVKATPAFNLSLCERFGVAPLEFDGRQDSLFQEFDRRGQRHMEYLRHHGHFADLPYDRMIAVFEEHYPSLMADNTLYVTGRFEDDAVA